MKVTVKTITQEAFEVEVNEDQTVLDLKNAIAAERGQDKFPAERQKLIYGGKILADDQVFSSLNFDEKRFIVLVLKPEAKKVEEAAPPAAAPAPTPTTTAEPEKPVQEAKATNTMKTLLVVALLGVASAVIIPEQRHAGGAAKFADELSGLDLVNYVNSVQNLWKAKLSPRFAQYPDAIKSRLMGVKMIEVPAEDRANERTYDHIEDATIPDSFDARTQWPNCPSISNIRDQSSCGSCWAFGAAEAMSDRICIATNGNTKVSISADDILACCGLICGNGCEGGYPIQAWKHWVSEGFVTGGNYTSKSGCKPYPFPPCEHHDNATRYQPCPSSIYPTNSCERKCQDGYTIPYNQDKHYGKSSYAVSKKVADIQKEIMTNGPVEVSYTVYEDFEHYTGGIYVHKSGKQLGGHAVKMLGWGTENGTPYWICANSWNSDWGENGFFRIIRGQNECGIESGVTAGEPKI